MPVRLPFNEVKNSEGSGGLMRELIIFNGLPRLASIDWATRTAKIGKRYYYWRDD